MTLYYEKKLGRYLDDRDPRSLQLNDEEAGWKPSTINISGGGGGGGGQGPVGPVGPTGPIGYNLDGGNPYSTYDAVSPIDGGTP